MRFHRFGDKIIFIPSMSIFSSLHSTDEKFSYCGGEINIYVLYVGDMFISYDAQFILISQHYHYSFSFAVIQFEAR